MPFSGVAVVLGGIHVRFSRAVALQHGGLLVSRRCPAVRVTGLQMPRRSRFVGLACAFQGLISPALGMFGRLQGGRHSFGQFLTSIAQFIRPRPGQFSPVVRGIVWWGGRHHVPKVVC